jgi:hypothetical protein
MFDYSAQLVEPFTCGDPVSLSAMGKASRRSVVLHSSFAVSNGATFKLAHHAVSLP